MSPFTPGGESKLEEQQGVPITTSTEPIIKLSPLAQMFKDLRAIKAAKDAHKIAPMDQRHTLNHTMLRTLEKIEKLDLSIFGMGFDTSKHERRTAEKQRHFYEKVKSCVPNFSGNISNNNVNWLIELDIMKRVNSNGMIKTCMSPKFGTRRIEIKNMPYKDKLYPYVQGLMELAYH